MENRSWDTTTWVGDSTKIREQLDWQVQTSFTDGLQKTADWLQGDQKLFEHYQANIFRG